MKFVSEKFHELENYRLEKEQLANDLKSKVLSFNQKNENIVARVDKQVRYSRRNCLLLHGIKKKNYENIENLVLEVINEN